jgi:hypothetical protein
MRVLVAVGALPVPEPKVIPRPLAAMTAAAGNGLVLALQREAGPLVLRDGKEGRPESVLVVAGRAVRRAEFGAMHVPVTVAALRVLQAPVAARHRELRKMATIASDLGMQPSQGKVRHGMSPKADPSWQTQPANVGMAGFAAISELRLVHRRVAGHAIGSGARSVDVALIVTGLALGSGMPAREAETRVIVADVGNLAPVVLVVARRALGSGKPILVRIFVAGDATGWKAEKGGVTPSVAAIVALLASYRCVCPLENPSG